jgi:very-short-patch-repair endonuclease
MSLPYNKKLISRAKELRKNMTKEEKRLWYDFLSKYPIRFQRQKVIDNYIVDFYCHQAKLVVELDGSQHFSPEAVTYDDTRTKALENRGLCVIRFTNNDIHHHFEGVCQQIDRYIRNPPV